MSSKLSPTICVIWCQNVTNYLILFLAEVDKILLDEMVNNEFGIILGSIADKSLLDEVVNYEIGIILNGIIDGI